MNAPDSKFKLGLTGNQLKIIAMVAMFVGHMALAFAPDAHNVIRFGRIAFPIFAYMIAEGCTYTKNRSKHLALIMAVAVIFHAVGYILTGSLQLSVLVSFSLAIITIYSADTFFDEDATLWEFFLAICGLCLVVFMTLIAPHLYEEQGYMIIYGLAGVLFPVAVYYAPGRFWKLVAAAVMTAFLGFTLPGYSQQWWALMAIPLLALYNGRRGEANLKYLFYIFYPLQRAFIFLLAMLIDVLERLGIF